MYVRTGTDHTTGGIVKMSGSIYLAIWRRELSNSTLLIVLPSRTAKPLVADSEGRKKKKKKKTPRGERGLRWCSFFFFFFLV